MIRCPVVLERMSLVDVARATIREDLVSERWRARAAARRGAGEGVTRLTGMELEDTSNEDCVPEPLFSEAPISLQAKLHGDRANLRGPLRQDERARVSGAGCSQRRDRRDWIGA